MSNKRNSENSLSRKDLKLGFLTAKNDVIVVNFKQNWYFKNGIFLQFIYLSQSFKDTQCLV